MSNDKDLNILNYNYPEILTLFNVKRDFKNSIIKEIEDKIEKIKKSLTYDYYHFYYKAYKIIFIIHQLFKKQIIQDEDNVNHIEFYVSSIKKIDSFENLEIDKIFDLLDVNISKKENAEKKEPIQPSFLKNNVVNSYPYPVAPTNLNYIKRVTQFKNLNLNSCFRHNYYATNPCDYQYTLPTEIKNVVSMRLASIELPNSWYLYNQSKKSNCFKVEIRQPGADTSTSYDIIIPEGNYDIDSIEVYLNNTYFFNSTTSNIELRQIRFSIDSTSFKATFEILSGNQYNLIFSFVFSYDPNHNIMNTLGWMLGFRLGAYINVDSSITSEGMFDGGGDRYIYVSINDYQYNNNALNMVCFDGSIMEEDIIGKIPIVNGKFSIILTENNSLVKMRKYNGPVNIRNLHIKILDKFGDVIDLNNMDYSFTLEFEILYENFGFNHENISR
jgi:hypothetical protein